MIFRVFLAGCAAMFVAIVLLVGFSVMSEITLGPKTFVAKVKVASYADARNAANIIDAGIARKVPCGSRTESAFDIYGKPRLWVIKPVRPAADGYVPWACYDGPASDRQRGDAFPTLQPITAEIVAEIVDRKEYYPAYEAPPYTKPPAPTYVAPTPQPTAPPIQNRELGDRPCCQ